VNRELSRRGVSVSPVAPAPWDSAPAMACGFSSACKLAISDKTVVGPHHHQREPDHVSQALAGGFQVGSCEGPKSTDYSRKLSFWAGFCFRPQRTEEAVDARVGALG
jgi:hypothetical protein